MTTTPGRASQRLTSDLLQRRTQMFQFVSLPVAALLGLAFTLSACGGKSAVPVSTLPTNPQAFFEANGVPVQTKTMTLGSSAVSVTFAGGTTLTFAPGSVQDESGNVYSGEVQLKVREVQRKSDMLLSNVLSVSNTSPLVSGGMFFLDLKTPSGAALNVNPVQGVGAAVPVVGKPNDRMQQFVGQGTSCSQQGGGAGAGPVTSAPLASGDSSVNWCPVAGQFGINTSTPPGSYVFSIFGKGWINCDFFYQDSRPKTTVHVGFTAINDANTVVFLVPQGINTVIALYTQDGSNQRKSYDNSLPIGLNTELVALTFNAGKQYLAHKTVTVSTNLSENLTFNEISTADLKAYLATLN